MWKRRSQSTPARTSQVSKVQAKSEVSTMALFKRGKWWWTDFSVNGARYRQPLRTKDWRAALQREKELIADASTGKLVPTSQQFSRLAFSEAADRYLEGRRLELSVRSLKKEQQLLAEP